MISVIIWLFSQLLLVVLLFFWPLARGVNSSWSNLISSQGTQLPPAMAGLDLSFEWFAPRLVLYVPLSIAILVVLTLLGNWDVE